MTLKLSSHGKELLENEEPSCNGTHPNPINQAHTHHSAHTTLTMQPGDSITVRLADRIPGEYTFTHQDVWDFMVMKDANELQDRRQRELVERAQRNTSVAQAQAMLNAAHGPQNLTGGILGDITSRIMEEQKKKIN